MVRLDAKHRVFLPANGVVSHPIVEGAKFFAQTENSTSDSLFSIYFRQFFFQSFFKSPNRTHTHFLFLF